MKILVLGYGNPGRRDDGLGPALAGSVEGWELAGVRVSVDYQLNIEHAAEVAESRLVIFLDASLEAPAPFGFHRAQPLVKNSITTHAMAPETVLATCREVYGDPPPAFVLAIAGQDFAMGEGLTAAAEERLAAPASFLERLLRSPNPLDSCRRAAGESC